MSNNTMLYALYRMGYHGRATVHGFRAMASTALNEMGFRPDVIEQGLTAPCTGLMDSPSKQFFAGSGLALNKDWNRPRRGLLGAADEPLHARCA